MAKASQRAPRLAAFGLVPVLILAIGGSAAARSPSLTPEAFDAVRTRLRAELERTDAAPTPRAGPAEVALGRQLFTDTRFSWMRNQSCASCHQLTPARDAKTHLPLPAPGFVDPVGVETGRPVSRGSIPSRFGSLNAPSVGYAAFSPAFHYDEAEGLYVGGLFWNGRAKTLADQAAQPFLNPVEMAMPSRAAVVARLREAPAYRGPFLSLYGIDLAKTPTAAQTDAAFGAMTRAIASFEATLTFGPFTSKFDFYMGGRAQLTAQERAGLDLFIGKARCSACHDVAPAQNPDGSWRGALFTDFTYDNIGLPRNYLIPGAPAPDWGLGGRADIAAVDPTGAEIGKHRVMSLRNIAITPPYGHNGVFRTLEQVVHFYNTRDTLGRVSTNTDPGFGIKGWPPAEIPQTVNRDELGRLGLTAAEEAALVAFLKTLTDGYSVWGRDPDVPAGAPSPYLR